MVNRNSGEVLWDKYDVPLGRVCRRTLAGVGDGDTIFYGVTNVGPRKNGTRLLHVELIAEENAKRLTKYPKVGKPVDWYKHTEKDGDKVDIEEENLAMQERYEEADDDSNEENTEKEKPGISENSTGKVTNSTDQNDASIAANTKSNKKKKKTSN